MSTRRLSLATALLLAVAVLPLAACSGGTPASTQAVTVETAPSAEPSPTGTPESAAPSPASTTDAAQPALETFTMPALVGVNLQLGRDTLQAAGAQVLDQTDASGLDRDHVTDSNWRICSQHPAEGTVVRVDAEVTLASVKVEEICP